MRLVSQPGDGPLHGALRPPSDKSISHRALMFAAFAEGISTLKGVLRAADTDATRAACAALGARFKDGPEGLVTVTGMAGRCHPPDAPLDLGNSGTGLRLLAGLLAGQPFDSELTGDESLRRRPMARIVLPLTEMGARIETATDGRPPLCIHGGSLHGIDYRSPVASAQVKSCVLLAGLSAHGVTRVSEPLPSRDHTERLLPVFGVETEGAARVSGPARLVAADLEVPADPSSAAFLLGAAALRPGSSVRLADVGVNPTRDGVLRALRAMGARIELVEARHFGGEPVADLVIEATEGLRGMSIGREDVPAVIDELPLLMALAAAADGETTIRGAAELRVKESDRLQVMCRGLRALGVVVDEFEDGARIVGGPVRGGHVNAHGDHRCAMAFAVLGQVAESPVTIEGAEWIQTSYPGFVDDMRTIGATLGEVVNS